MILQHEIMKEMIGILHDRKILTKSELVDLSCDIMRDQVPKYQILNAWNRLKDEGLVISTGNLPSKCFKVSSVGNSFFKEADNTVSLIEAITILYHHRQKNNQISFAIQFNDGTGRAVIIWKTWSVVLNCWEYGIKEENCPGITSSELGFIGNLANVDGIRFGGNKPGYIVFKN